MPIRKNLHSYLYGILHSHLYANAHSLIRTRGTTRYTLCCTTPYTLQCTRAYTHDARAHIRHNARAPIHVILHTGLYANFCTHIYTLYVRLYVKNCTSAYTLFFLASCFSWLDFWRRKLADLGGSTPAAWRRLQQHGGGLHQIFRRRSDIDTRPGANTGSEYHTRTAQKYIELYLKMLKCF